MSGQPVPVAVLICPACGTQLARSLLSCPKCQRLVHTDRLKGLAAEAERLTVAGDLAGALQCWRRTLELLPVNSRQYATIVARVDTLGRQVDLLPGIEVKTADGGVPAAGAPHSRARRAGWFAGAGAIALLLLTKGKLLLLGLTKAGTVLSMLASLGVYWTQWGWKFALGLVLSIYIHEMGHVAMLRRYGLPASAPMFIPGFGALVRLKQAPANAREDARIGLAGPAWGLAGMLATWLAATGFGWPSWIAIAHVAAWINLFNLLPVWQLDGSRGFRALTREQRWILVGVMGAMWFWTSEGLLLLILLVTAGRTLLERGAESSDRPTLLCFIGLIVVLTLFARPGGFSLAF